MITYRDFVSAFRRLGLDQGNRVLAHASLSAFGEVVGGAEAVVGAMVSAIDTVIMPAFTTRTMVVPPVGPENNALDYETRGHNSVEAEFWHPDLSPDRDVGAVAQALRLHPEARRSSHPILSFTGIGAQKYLEAQTLKDPMAPIGELADDDGDVLLLGVDHRVNIAAHYAEQKAGRRQFVRWALTSAGIQECPSYPGCSDGFYVLSERLSGVRRRVDLGHGVVEAVPLRDLIHIVTGWIREDPTALLCDRPSCRRCQAVRQSVQVP